MINQDQKINELKDKINDLMEYLRSDTCQKCYDSSLKLDSLQKELSRILEK